MNPEIFKRILSEKLKETDIKKLSVKDINVKNNDGNTPLHYAIINKKTNVVIDLLKSDKINFTAVNKKNNTILDEAILNLNDDIIETIIENKKFTQLLQTQSLYNNAMQNMEKMKKWNIIKIVFDKLPEEELNNSNNFDIWTKIVKNENLENLAEQMYNKISEQIDEETAKLPYFKVAIESRKWKLSEAVLDDISDDVIEPITFENTFTIALEAKKLDIVKNLIEKTEIRAFTDKNIIFPKLEKVVKDSNWEIRDQLINKIDESLELSILEDKESKLLVHYAITSENWIVAGQLINELPCEKLSIRSKDNFTPLHLAIAKGNTKLTLNLIDKIPSQNLIYRDNKYNCTPLDMAINTKQTQVMIKIIEKLPTNKINDINADGDTAIHLALKQNDSTVLQAIKFSHQGDIDFNVKNHASHSPLDLLNENSAGIFRFPKINNKYKDLEFNKNKGDFSDSIWKEIELAVKQVETSKIELKKCADSDELIKELNKKKPEKEIMETITSQKLHKKNDDLEMCFNKYCNNIKNLKKLKKQARIEMTNSLNSLSMKMKAHLNPLNESDFKCQREYTIEESNHLAVESVLNNFSNLENKQSVSNLEQITKLSAEYNSLQEKRLYVADNIESDIYLFKENEFKDHEYGRPAIIVGYNKNNTNEVLFLPGTSQEHGHPDCEIILDLKISEAHPLPEIRNEHTYFFSNTFRWSHKDCIKNYWNTDVKLNLDNKQSVAKKLSAMYMDNLEQELKQINILRQNINEKLNLKRIELNSYATELHSDLQSNSEDMKARIRKRAEENRNKQKQLNEDKNEISKLEMNKINTELQNKEKSQIYETEQAVKNKKREDLDLQRQQKLTEFYELQDKEQKNKQSNLEVNKQDRIDSLKYKKNLEKFNQSSSKENQIDQDYQLTRKRIQQLNSKLTKKSSQSDSNQDSKTSIEKKETNIKINQAKLKFLQNLEDEKRIEKEKQKEKELAEKQQKEKKLAERKQKEKELEKKQQKEKSTLNK